MCDLWYTRTETFFGTLRLFHAEECGFAGASANPGDFTCKETHVPIPNTTVKLAGPMIVPTSAKVGIAGFLKASQTSV